MARYTTKSLLKHFPQIHAVSTDGGGTYVIYLHGGYAVTWEEGSHSVTATVGNLTSAANYARRAKFCYCEFCRKALIQSVMEGRADDYVDEWKKGLTTTANDATL